MKKFVNIFSVALLIIALTTTVTLCGCSTAYTDPGEFKKEENGFYYYLVDKKGNPVGDGLFRAPATESVILGIRAASNTDELIIPEKLGGYPVSMIGKTFHLIWQDPVVYEARPSGYKRVVINHKLSINRGLGGFSGELVLNELAYLGGSTIKDCGSIQINKDIEPSKIDTYFEDWEFYDWLYKFKKEVKFDAAGGQLKTYTTLIKNNTLLPEPEQPIRDGYTFAGWYTDQTCQAKWNFEEDKVTENMTLYAGWIKN